MRLAKRLGLVLLAVCAFSAMAVSSAWAEPRFLAHPPGPLSAKTLTTQILTTSAGSVECTAVSLSNTSAAALVTTVQEATVNYEKCTAFGIAEAKISPVLYDIHANGEVDLLNTVTITAPLCEVKVFPKNKLKEVLFRSLHGAISITAHVNGIESEGKGFACTYAKESKGTDVGVIDVWLTNGGTLLWHAS